MNVVSLKIVFALKFSSICLCAGGVWAVQAICAPVSLRSMHNIEHILGTL